MVLLGASGVAIYLHCLHLLKIINTYYIYNMTTNKSNKIGIILTVIGGEPYAKLKSSL